MFVSSVGWTWGAVSASEFEKIMFDFVRKLKENVATTLKSLGYEVVAVDANVGLRGNELIGTTIVWTTNVRVDETTLLTVTKRVVSQLLSYYRVAIAYPPPPTPPLPPPLPPAPPTPPLPPAKGEEAIQKAVEHMQAISPAPTPPPAPTTKGEAIQEATEYVQAISPTPTIPPAPEVGLGVGLGVGALLLLLLLLFMK